MRVRVGASSPSIKSKKWPGAFAFQKTFLRAEQAEKARDVTGFRAFFLVRRSGNFLRLWRRSPYQITKKRGGGKSTGKKIETSSVENSPKLHCANFVLRKCGSKFSRSFLMVSSPPSYQLGMSIVSESLLSLGPLHGGSAMKAGLLPANPCFPLPFSTGVFLEASRRVPNTNGH